MISLKIEQLLWNSCSKQNMAKLLIINFMVTGILSLDSERATIAMSQLMKNK
jgi:hypothetical protein